jgi:lysylphosphatidylglycerol synthetase-like protein (DUF2156 family)
MQAVVARMASNSANCKNMSVAILSALLALLATANVLEYVWVCLIPVTLFYFLDSYYLHLEQGFRERYKWVVKKHHDDELDDRELYDIKSHDTKWSKAFCSPSTWLVYVVKAILILGVSFLSPAGQSDDNNGVGLQLKNEPAVAIEQPKVSEAGVDKETKCQ